MKIRKVKKLSKCGTLLTIEGSSCVFMSLGFMAGNRIDSFNGIDIRKREFISRCDGKARLATKRECKMYWSIMKRHLSKLKEKCLERTEF